MRRTAISAVAAAVLFPAPVIARAQDPDQPLMMAGVAGGATIGRALWSVAPQLAAVPGTSTFDTLAVERRLPAALALGVNIAYYRRWLGYTFESTWVALRSESRCQLLAAQYNQTDPNQLNAQTCTSLQGMNHSTSAMTLQLGVSLRARYATATQPYVRASAGIAFIGGNFVATSGIASTSTCNQCRRTLMDAPRPGAAVAATAAAGLMVRFQAAYQFRFELRDQMLLLQEATGPADPLTLATPTAWQWQHLPTLVLGMDVLLVRSHTRRY